MRKQVSSWDVRVPYAHGDKKARSAKLWYNFLVEQGSAETSMVSDKPVPSPPLACEEIVELYLRDVDRSLIRENLRLSYTERLLRLQHNVQAANKVRGAGIRALKSRR
jgi:hypothetical protein